MSEPTFPWEGGYDRDQPAEEYAEHHGLDLEETKRKFAELRAKVAQEMDSGIIPCDQIIYEKPVPHSPE